MIMYMDNPENETHKVTDNKVIDNKVIDNKVTDKAFIVAGNVDCGKSTLIGTLITNNLDDGRGSARMHVAKHKHEIMSGKTSDVSTKNIIFPNGSSASIIDLCGHEKYFTTTASGISNTWADYAIVVVSPSRGVLDMTRQHFKMLISYNIPIMIVVTRLDMALEDSCKITDKQITDLCMKPYKRRPHFINDYNNYHSFVRGSILAKEHNINDNNNDNKNIAPAFPIVFHDQNTGVKIYRECFNKNELIDINTFLEFEKTKAKNTVEIYNNLKMVSGRQNIIPVVYVSNVNGYYLDVIKNVMMNVETRDLWAADGNVSSIIKFFRENKKINIPQNIDKHIGATFYIDNVYNVRGVGVVVAGINRGDTIHTNDEMFLGPFGKNFIRVKLRSLHNDKRDVVDSLQHHHRGCIAIKGIRDEIKKNQIRRGVVLLSTNGNPLGPKVELSRYVCFKFEAAITIFNGHSTTLRTGYSPVIHAGSVRQAAKLILPNTSEQQVIKSGDVERVMFKFRSYPEYIDPGMVFVFRSGDLHGVGYVISPIPIEDDDNPYPEPPKNRVNKRNKKVSVRVSNHK